MKTVEIKSNCKSRDKRVLKFAFIICVLFSFSSFQTATEISEPTVKALFIYNFTKYVEWPKEKYVSRFIIGFYGNSPVADELKLICTGKKIKDKEVEIRFLEDENDIRKCDVLFIPKDKTVSMKKINELVQDKEVLIITEEEGMALKGSAINIIKQKEKFRFELNEFGIKNAGLKASTQLLDMSILIKV